MEPLRQRKKHQKRDGKSKFVQTTKIDHYYIVKKLGSGSFAEVSLAIHEFLEKKIAVKKILKKRIEKQKDIMRHQTEIRIMKSMI